METCLRFAGAFEPGDAKHADARVVPFVFSTESVDSHGTSIDASSWRLQRFQANPVVLYQHDHERPIGWARNTRVENGVLRGDIQFADAKDEPLAEEVLRKVRAGLVRGASVGFARPNGPVKSWASEEKSADGSTFLKLRNLELIEVSVVTIPSNPESLAEVRSALREHMTEAIHTEGVALSPADLGFAADATRDAVLGGIAALRASLETSGKEIAELRAKVAGFERAAEESERTATIARLVAEGRITPVQETALREKPLDFVRSFAEIAGQQAPALNRAATTEPTHTATVSDGFKGLSFEDLVDKSKADFRVMHDLKEANPSLFSRVIAERIKRVGK